MSESVPFPLLFISLNKDKNFLMNFNVVISPYITRMSCGLEERTREQQTRSPSEDIFVFSCIKDKIPGSNNDRSKFISSPHRLDRLLCLRSLLFSR